MMAKIGEGTLGGEAYVITLENGGLEMVLSEAVAAEDAAQIQEWVDTLTAGIISGEIVPLPTEPAATPEAGG
ncbi:MAG: hypothetical protein IPK19_02690 [Chloroflexi bacterium]|nr:hypothetical protein [Chloroflexota bacterium]